MAMDGETRAILDGQRQEIKEIKEWLGEISKAVTAFVKYETRQDVVETNMSDHETRIRKIEGYMWVVVLIAGIFTTVAGKLSYDAVSIMDEAKSQRPITAEQYTEATKKAVIEALKSNDTNTNN